ncbi:MAG: cysteine synthase family protein [Chlorobi bacterium]|nr:cysteine synthase family protein [Chlorobiota bacterium]
MVIVNKRVLGLSNLIGNTPLYCINFKFDGEPRKIYAKAENLNMTGSIKDRMAFHIISKAYSKGALKAGDLIIEATSGNTGISVTAIGRALGHPVSIFMPNWMSRERIDLIGSFGATINLVTKEQGGFLGSIEMANNLAKNNEHTFLPSQFSNEDNIDAHYQTTGPEIWWQLKYRYLKPDAFVAGVGTGGTVMGVGKYLREQNPDIKIHPLEPANSPTLSTGCKIGKHRIQGISDEFIPSIVNLNKLDSVVSIDDGDSIIMAKKLANSLGIGVGISSGANFLGALKIQNKLGKDAVVVTVFPDDNKKYLSTDLLKEEAIKNNFLSTKVELDDFRAFKRVCQTCCDPTDCIEAAYSGAKDDFVLPNCPRRH